MSTETPAPKPVPPEERRDRALAGIGAVACAPFAVAVLQFGARSEAMAVLLLTFGMVVLFPLATKLAEAADDPAWVRAVWPRLWWVRSLAAVTACVAMFDAPGSRAAVCALPWAAFLFFLAATGASRLLRHRGRDAAALLRDGGLVLGAVGAAWFLADRLGLRPLGFAPAIVMLTAVHFHFAGILLPLVAARALVHVRAPWLAWWILAGVPLVAVGITVSQLGGGHLVEAVAAWVMALGGLAVAAVHWQLSRHPGTRGSPRIWWRIAAASLALGMLLAAMYGSRGFLAVPLWLDLPWMRAVHGTLNAFGFSLCALLGWRAVEVQRAQAAA